MAGRYGLQIRSATSADAAGLAELMEGVGLRRPTADWAKRLEAIERQDGIVLLALEWGPPSGLIAIRWFPALLADHPVAQVTTLLVARAERRRGIGRLLLKAGAQAARAAGCDDLRLLTAENEPTLPAFARANGFVPDGEVLTRALRKTGR